MFMEIVLYLYSFILGAIIASFINVVVWRLPQGLDFVKGRSFCPTCHHTLAWYDLFPIFSWLFLKGSCRYCHDTISMRYPLVELLGGLLGMLSLNVYGMSWECLVVLVILMILLTISLIDHDTMLIPDGLQFALCIPVIVLSLMQADPTWIERIIGCLIIALPMLLLTYLIPDCFGGGDIKLMFICGFLLGWSHTLLAMFVAVLLAGSYAIYLLACKKVDKKAHIAFGPYLCIGIACSLCFGSELIHWYVSLFL